MAIDPMASGGQGHPCPHRIAVAGNYATAVLGNHELVGDPQDRNNERGVAGTVIGVITAKRTIIITAVIGDGGSRNADA